MSSFTLKTYQSDALGALELFLRQAETMGLEPAWAHAMRREGGKPGLPYRSDELGQAPCVCLRIPTGGGKTLLASHAIALIARTWAHREFPLALWLVPSDAIRSQPLDALQTPGHAYRAALEDVYGARFQICDLDTHCMRYRRRAMASRPSSSWPRSRAFASATRPGDASMR